MVEVEILTWESKELSTPQRVLGRISDEHMRSVVFEKSGLWRDHGVSRHQASTRRAMRGPIQSRLAYTGRCTLGEQLSAVRLETSERKQKVSESRRATAQTWLESSQ